MEEGRVMGREMNLFLSVLGHEMGLESRPVVAEEGTYRLSIAGSG